jgi:uncharacterized membrane protein
MSAKSFNFGDVLGYGWAVMKANFWFFVALGIVSVIVEQLPNIINEMLQYMPLTEPAHILSELFFGVVSAVISIVITIGFIKIALSLCDRAKPGFGTLFDGWDCFWRYVGASILYTLIVLAGFFLLVIPCIVWAIKYSLCFYFVVDKGLGPVDAIKASGKATMGAKWQLLGFGFVCGLVNLLGFLCLIVGLFATYPTVLVATALVYRHLAEQTPELAQFGIGQQQIYPPDETETTYENWRGQ